MCGVCGFANVSEDSLPGMVSLLMFSLMIWRF
jgi:hypothetical protein